MFFSFVEIHEFKNQFLKIDIMNPTDPKKKMWKDFSKKRKYFILHIENLI